MILGRNLRSMASGVVSDLVRGLFELEELVVNVSSDSFGVYLAFLVLGVLSLL